MKSREPRPWVCPMGCRAGSTAGCPAGRPWVAAPAACRGPAARACPRRGPAAKGAPRAVTVCSRGGGRGGPSGSRPQEGERRRAGARAEEGASVAERSRTRIRNVALVGHHGAGKTTLAEALLAATGTITRQGSVEKGNTVCDTEPEAVNRQLSISLAVAPFVLDGVKVNVLDTPGYPDFECDVLAA